MRLEKATGGMRLALTVLVALTAAGHGQDSRRTTGPQNFIFFNRDRDRISEISFLANRGVLGAQLKYTWRELEPERDRYEVGRILEDLEFLERHGKRLFVQLQDVSFDERLNIPDYVVEDPRYGGGAARKYESEESDDSDATFDGWVARRWDPAVRARFSKLLRALGRQLDGRIEGISLPETSIGFGETGTLHPVGFTYETYAEGVKATMTSARQAFPRSHVIQYANFMPGEWLPGGDAGYLRGLYEHAERIGAGVGGPDLLPYRKWQRNHSYPLIASRGPGVAAGLAVQWGNLEDVNPSTGEPVTVADLYGFARDTLRLDYIFWGVQEPYYSRDVLPFIADRAEARP